MMYRLFDITLDSDMPLPELPRGDAGGFCIRVSSAPGSQRPAMNPDWFHDWLDEYESIVMSCGRVNDGFLLRFPNIADFYISSPGDVIHYFSDEAVPNETLRHLLIDQVVPRILGQQGRLVLHASAIQYPQGKAIAFVGSTGWGKSTLAAGYLQDGARVITDDCLLIVPSRNKIDCISNYSGLRLYEDSTDRFFSANETFSRVSHYSDKKRLISHAGETGTHEPVPLGAIFLLAEPGDDTHDIRIRELKGAQDLVAFISQLFLLDVTDKSVVAGQFNGVKRIVECLPAIYSIEYPRDYDQLATVRDRVSRVLENPVVADQSCTN